MSKVSFGIFYAGAFNPPNVVPLARKLEELGFDGFWWGEFPTNRGPSLDNFTTLCFAAAATTTLRVGSNVTLLPLHHPAWVAKQWGALDILSNGRSILTVGAGGEFPKQFDAFGVTVEDRGRRTDESLEVIKSLWTEDESSYQGKFFKFEGITMEPKPRTRPHPPIWVGGRPGGIQSDREGNRQYKSRNAAIRRAAKYGDGWCPYYMTPDSYRDSVRQIKQICAEAGRDISHMAWALNIRFWMRDTYEKSLSDAKAHLRYGRNLGDKVRRYDILGTPKDMIPQIEAFAQAGVRHLIIHLNSPEDLKDAHLTILANEVLPYFS